MPCHLEVESIHQAAKKEKKRKREDEFIASQKGALDKFVKVNSNPSRNDEELAIIAVEEQINGGSEENIDIQEDDNNVSDPENIADPAERSFSKLKLLLNYLRSTMSQERLNGLATLCIEKLLLDQIDLNTIIDDFVSRNATRNCSK